MKTFTLFSHISELLTVASEEVTFKRGAEMSRLDALKDAYLLIENETGTVAEIGLMKDFIPSETRPVVKNVDCRGRTVLPGFVDSHTHLVYSHSREEEFVMRIKGATYEEISKAGGGIRNSARKMQSASEEQLLIAALNRCSEILRTGTVAVEIKSGYGLTVESELKMLRVIQKLKALVPQTVKATFLGAHAVPSEYQTRREVYIDLVCKEMLPQIAEEKLADYIDVFCETGFFTQAETEHILRAGQDFGLKGRVHANELDYSGGVQAAVNGGAVSADHLECVGEAEISCLLSSETIPTLLPATAFFLGIPYAPARKMMDSGLGLALASDFNPGTCPTGNMPFIVSLGCIQMKMLPEEALNAATLNAAKALELESTHGKIAVGRPANILVTRSAGSYYELPYYFASPMIEKVFIEGKEV